MSELCAHTLLMRLPAAKQDQVLRWMSSYGITGETLTLPMLRLLSAAVDTDDEGTKRVIAALLEQECPAPRAAEA
jgi:hypothetical protein